MKGRPFYILLILVFLSGCVSSRGDLFEKVTAPAPEDPEKTKEEEYYDDEVDEADDYTPGLEIQTKPAGAEIYFDRSYRGTGTVFIDNPSTGEYLLRITKEGYYPIEDWIRFKEGDYRVLVYHLEEITGFLDVTTEPAGARIFVDGNPVDSMPAELRIGTHTVRAELFGYEGDPETVTLRDGETISLTLSLLPSPFAVTDASVSPGTFNPANPGVFGKTTLRFYAHNRGSAEVTIHDTDGRALRTLRTEPFTRKLQTLAWDGLDDTGKPVPGGRYTLRVKAVGDDGTLSEVSADVKVDPALVIKPRIFTSGLPGLLYCPTPDVLTPEGLQISAAALGQSVAGTAYVPVVTGLRFSLPGGSGFTLQGSLLAVSGEDDGYGLAVVIKHPLTGDASDRFSLAVAGKASFQGGRYTDTLTNFTGLSASLPAGLSLGPLKFYLAPELTVSYNYVDYGATVTQQPGLYAWAYGRAGLAVEIPGLSFGFSAALRTVPFSQGLALHLPMGIGAEINAVIPGTRSFASIYGVCEIESPSSYYLLYGAGLHFLY